MVALFAYDAAQKEWIPVDCKPNLGFLVLHAQWCTSQGLETYFQIGMSEEVINAETMEPTNL